jgi:hypothetical protein
MPPPGGARWPEASPVGVPPPPTAGAATRRQLWRLQTVPANEETWGNTRPE